MVRRWSRAFLPLSPSTKLAHKNLGNIPVTTPTQSKTPLLPQRKHASPFNGSEFLLGHWVSPYMVAYNFLAAVDCR